MTAVLHKMEGNNFEIYVYNIQKACMFTFCAVLFCSLPYFFYNNKNSFVFTFFCTFK